MMIPKLPLRGWASLLALLPLLALCSCSILSILGKKQEKLKINTQFSCNIFEPDAKWPGKHYVPTPAQEEVLSLRGEPDWVRLWYNPLGDLRFIYDNEIFMHFRTDTWNDLDRSWIYLDDEIEYVFKGSRIEERPLSDMLKIMVQRGDPQDVKHVPGSSGPLKVEWIYYQQGIRFLFIDGILTKTSHQRPINYIRR